MKYNKLVRDKIPEIIKAKGGKPVTRIAGDDEYWKYLKMKLREEVAEFEADGKDEELADILEVVHAIANFKNIDTNALEVMRKKKAEERGRFAKHLILLEDGR